MHPNLAACNANSDEVMPTWSAHAANPNSIMCSVHDMHMQASWASLCNIDALHYTY